MSEFEIITLKSGFNSLRSLVHQETFHPVTGPRAEANILHVRQQRLLERSRELEPLVIWDIGFGAAANALAAVEALQEGTSQVELHSFDKSLAPIEFAISHARELGYLEPHAALLARLLGSGQAQIRPGMSWHLHLGDFREVAVVPELPAPHALFYDPYSPVGNPEMWGLDHFTRLRSRLRDDAPCLLTNYTRSTAVRVTLLLAGFFVGQGCEVGEKSETTIASNRLDWLERPLDPTWLKRVRVSGNSAPMRGLHYSKAPINESDWAGLLAHPQFNARGERGISGP